jgi:RecB family exonuclease
VTFSYRSSDEDGNIVLASPFLDDIAALFPADWPGRRNRRLLADVVWSVEQAPTERERALAQAFAASAAGVSAAGGVGGAADASPETRVLGAQARSHVRHREVVSAGALELFAGCPVRWLVERQLEPERLEPDPAPVTRGSFIHTVLERVFARLDAPLMPGTLGTAEKLLGEEMRGSATAEDRAKLALDQANEVRSAILRGIEAELRRYLRHEAADGCEWPPLVTELRFGLDGDAEDAMPPVQLSDGQETVLLSGIIDRVDVDPGDRSRVIVRDYKSGAKRDTWPAARWAGDRQLQVALYMIAVQRLLGVRAVAGFYQPLAGDDLRPRGAHTAAVDVGVNVVMRDELADAELQQLLDQIEREAAGLAATLRRGELTPCPERCSPDGTCIHPGICWAAR